MMYFYERLLLHLLLEHSIPDSRFQISNFLLLDSIFRSMTRSRKIFLLATALFVAFLVFAVVDINRRTTPPWLRNKQKEAPKDSSSRHSSADSTTRPR